MSKKNRNFAPTKEKDMKQETQKEVARWMMDVAKYILTAAIVVSFLGEFSQKWVYYTAGLVFVCAFLFWGIRILDKTKNES